MMTREDILNMDNRTLDRLCAEKVMGWNQSIQRDGLCPPGETLHGVNVQSVPFYSANVAADYEVLVHVREKWTENMKERFAARLAEIRRIRSCEYATVQTIYLMLFGGDGLSTGDYAKAALLAAESEEQ